MPDATKKEAEPTDGREGGRWETRYPRAAWNCIWFELVYLLVLMALASGALMIIGVGFTNDHKSRLVMLPVFGFGLDRDILRWVSIALSGVLGGIAFDLKWLYHSVARGVWNEDRCLWRIIVPFISGVVALFLAFMIVSGIVPFIKLDAFRNLYFGLGFGFLFGYFSDNVLAALRRFADGAFGRSNDAAPGE